MNKIRLIPLIFISILVIALVSASLGTEIGPLKVEKGWNLLYGFADSKQFNSDFKDVAVSDSPIKIVYALNPITQQYAEVYPNLDSDKLRGISEKELMNTAFWVYSDQSFNTEYWLLEDAVPFGDRQIRKGWNFVGITDDLFMKKLDSIKGSCNIEKSYVFDAMTQNWVEYPTTENLNDNELKYSGWVIKVSNDCKLSSVNSQITSPPVLP